MVITGATLINVHREQVLIKLKNRVIRVLINANLVWIWTQISVVHVMRTYFYIRVNAGQNVLQINPGETS
jgi:hypothetical protein